MGRAYFTMPKDLFLTVMHLPADTDISLIFEDLEKAGIVRFQIEHPDLPEIEDGIAGPEISPVWGQAKDEAGQPIGPVQWVFLSPVPQQPGEGGTDAWPPVLGRDLRLAGRRRPDSGAERRQNSRPLAAFIPPLAGLLRQHGAEKRKAARAELEHDDAILQHEFAAETAAALHLVKSHDRLLEILEKTMERFWDDRERQAENMAAVLAAITDTRLVLVDMKATLSLHTLGTVWAELSDEQRQSIVQGKP